MDIKKKSFDVLSEINKIKNNKPSEKTIISLWRQFLNDCELKNSDKFTQIITELEKQNFISINKLGDESISITTKGLDWLENSSQNNELWK
jgi:predicted transcriptional regulator